MAQQVAHIRCHLVPVSPLLDTATWSLTYELQGTVATGFMGDVTTYLATHFGTAATGASQAPLYYMSGSLWQTGTPHWFGATDITAHLDGSPAGGETAATHFAIPGSGSAVANPEGVAAVITLRADYGSLEEFAPGSRPRARRRNRSYFGPISGQATSMDSSKRTTLGAGFMSDLAKWIAQAAQIPSTSGGGPWNLVTWSKRDQAVHDVLTVEIDDRPDYQRRRADTAGTNHMESTVLAPS